MERGKILESWKEIASYLKRNVRTCQMWERQHGLPVHRLDGSPKAHVFAYTEELDTWLDQKLHETERGTLVPDSGEHQADTPPRSRWRLGLGTALVIVTAAAGSLLVHTFITGNRNLSGRGLHEPKSWKNSIAVLPFEDLSPDGALGYRCETLANDIATKLAATGELKVSSRLSTRRFAGKKAERAEIRKDLGVANLLEATMHSDDELLRLNVSLVRTKDGVCLWSHSYAGVNEDMLKIEDEIFGDVAGRLGLVLTRENHDRSKRRDPKNTKDYDVFLLGRFYETRYSVTDDEEDFRRSAENLTAYLKINPGYAMAYCSLGTLYEHRFAIGGDPADESSMRLFYEKAYALDPGLEETNLGMGWVYFYRRDYDRAYDYFKRAVEMGPANPEVSWNVASFFLSIGLDEKAVRYYEKSLVSDPLNSFTFWLCAEGCLYAGEYEKGLNSIERALALDPDLAPFPVVCARLLVLLNRPEEALRRLDELPENAKSSPAFRPLRALISAASGDREKALSLLREMERLDPARRIMIRLDVAGTYSLLGMKKEAVQTIEEGIRTGFAAVKMELYSYPVLKSYPHFENLRDMPEFKAVVKRQKGIYDSRMKKYGDL